ncbi:DUF3592 domain-containing protein [Streptomyces sp. NPDC018693]|uniref:DUF3592 domain-containing protein n=1 Tax=unclassified Streptomyces TaxID=2593676 RepID=UPI003798893E
MDNVFYIVPSIVIAGAGFAAVLVVRRARRTARAWDSGLTAEARCLRTYTTTSRSGDRTLHTHLHHVYEFTTRDGRAVRFEERGGPGTTVEGDIVTVHYVPDRPEQATALTPARGRLAAEAGVLLVFCGVLIAFAVAFMAGAQDFFASDDFPAP